MEKYIYKYPIKITDNQTIELPEYAQILDVQIQNDVPVLWALVDPKEKPQKIDIEIIGTGNPITNHCVCREYISTIQLKGGNLVYHIFYSYK